MPVLGLDCALILDGQGYFIDPASFQVARPRIHAATVTLGGIRFADLGPGKRQWTFVVLAHQDMRTYAGQWVSRSGEQYRAALKSSYEKLTTLPFTDPKGDSYTVHFLDMTYAIPDVNAQAASQLQYSIHVTLLEA